MTTRALCGTFQSSPAQSARASKRGGATAIRTIFKIEGRVYTVTECLALTGLTELDFRKHLRRLQLQHKTNLTFDDFRG